MILLDLMISMEEHKIFLKKLVTSLPFLSLSEIIRSSLIGHLIFMVLSFQIIVCSSSAYQNSVVLYKTSAISERQTNPCAKPGGIHS